MTSVSQVTGSGPNPEARDVHNRSSAPLQSAVWTLSGKSPSVRETQALFEMFFNTNL